jgi:hypothetical protein
VLKDGQRVTITSINGVYNGKGDVLSLSDEITFNSASGYAAHLSDVNTARGNIVSERPVEAALPNDGLIKGNHLELWRMVPRSALTAA